MAMQQTDDGRPLDRSPITAALDTGKPLRRFEVVLARTGARGLWQAAPAPSPAREAQP